MAVRFDTTGEHYTRAITIGSVADWSAALWVKMVTDRAATSVLWQIDDGTGASFLRVSAWNGSALAFQTTGSTWFGTIGHTLIANEWTYVGMSATANPGQARVRVRPAGTSTFVGGSPTQANTTFTANSVRIGGTNSSTEWLNGSIAGVRMWNAALTEDELEAESWAYMPVRATNLRVWYPLLTPSTVDYSGNSESLSGGTGAALDDGPPISWWTARHRRATLIPVSGVSGALAGTLPALTGSMTGAVTASGTLAGTLPPLTSSMTGTAKVISALAGTLPSLTASLAGTVAVSVLNANLPALTGSLTGTVKTSGPLVGTLPALTGSFAGEAAIPPDDLTVSTPGPARGWAAGQVSRGWDSSSPARGWAAGSPTT